MIFRYADNAKQIINKAVVNEGASAKVIRELQQQIEALKGAMSAENEAKLHEAQRLLEERTQTYEEKLHRTKIELLERLKFAEGRAAAAFLQASQVEQKSAKKTQSLSRMRWHNSFKMITIQSKLALLSRSNSDHHSRSRSRGSTPPPPGGSRRGPRCRPATVGRARAA